MDEEYMLMVFCLLLQDKNLFLLFHDAQFQLQTENNAILAHPGETAYRPVLQSTKSAGRSVHYLCPLIRLMEARKH